jgi:tetratricopeptide (TPR) repeat protein
MPGKSSKSIAVVLLIVLGIIFAAVAGLLSNLLAGHPYLSSWVNNNPWYSFRVLLAALTVVTTALIAVAVWQFRVSNNSKDQQVTLQHLDAATRTMLEGFREVARQQGLIPAQSDQNKDAEITRLTQELKKLQQQVAARSSEPSEAELEKLLSARDLDGALRLKTQQVQARRAESERLPRDLYELGTIHELRFEWPQALAAFREAWQLGRDPEHGFKYAHFAAKLNHFPEAIAAYEALLQVYADPADRAGR